MLPTPRAEEHQIHFPWLVERLNTETTDLHHQAEGSACQGSGGGGDFAHRCSARSTEASPRVVWLTLYTPAGPSLMHTATSGSPCKRPGGECRWAQSIPVKVTSPATSRDGSRRHGGHWRYTLTKADFTNCQLPNPAGTARRPVGW